MRRLVPCTASTSLLAISKTKLASRSIVRGQLRSFSDCPPKHSQKRTWPYHLAATVAIGAFAWTIGAGLALTEKKIPGENRKEFTPYILLDKVPVSSTSSIFVLAPAERTGSSSVGELHLEGLWNTELKQPDLQIARVYTPLPLSTEEKSKYGQDAMRLWIRQEEHGEVSRWVHRLPLGTKISFRGPNTQCVLPRDLDEILFLVGGTGLTPALQIAHRLVDNASSPENLPRIHIMWANRHREDCLGGSDDTQAPSGWFKWLHGSTNSQQLAGQSLLVEELEQLKAVYDGKLRVDYFVDDEKSFITSDVLEAALSSSRVGKIAGPAKPEQTRLVFVSGPDGFVAHLAGAKKWLGGREVQGELGGLLEDIEKPGWKVWKL